jgi:hypothetical protein
MRRARHIALATLVVLTLELAAGSAGAESKLTDFNGNWQGRGTDRSSPFETVQGTSCQQTNNATLSRMISKIVCTGDAGLNKTTQMTITLAGDTLSGNLTQTQTTRGSDAPPTVYKGSIFGHKTDNAANFKVSFSGLTPSVEVSLKLINPSSFSMQATTLGSVLTDVTYNRAAKP